jgi:hypothetical protein
MNTQTPGEQLMLWRKVIGLRPSERIVGMTAAEVVSVWREPLSVITTEDGAAEGFPDWAHAVTRRVSLPHARGLQPRYRGHAHRLVPFSAALESGMNALPPRVRPRGGMQWPS